MSMTLGQTPPFIYKTGVRVEDWNEPSVAPSSERTTPLWDMESDTFTPPRSRFAFISQPYSANYLQTGQPWQILPFSTPPASHYGFTSVVGVPTFPQFQSSSLNAYGAIALPSHISKREILPYPVSTDNQTTGSPDILSAPFPTFDFQQALIDQCDREDPQSPELSDISRSTSPEVALHSPPQTPAENDRSHINLEEQTVDRITAAKQSPKRTPTPKDTDLQPPHRDASRSSRSSGKYACRHGGCQWRFDRASTLKRHMITHRENTYFCPNDLCPTNNVKNKTGFPRRCSIRRHLRDKDDGHPCRKAAEKLGWTGYVHKDEERFNLSSPECVLQSWIAYD